MKNKTKDTDNKIYQSLSLQPCNGNLNNKGKNISLKTY